MKIVYSFSSTFLLFLMALNFCQATTIAPFENLGEMAKGSDAVVLVKAQRNYTVEEGANTRFRTQLEVIDVVKGLLSPGDVIALQNYHTKIGDLERKVWGDLELKEGKTYFLFLDRMDNNVWRAQMLSYAAFEEFEKAGEKVLVPFDLGMEVHVYVPEGGAQPEPLGVFSTSKLTDMLAEVLSVEKNWNRNDVVTDYHPTEFDAGSRGVPPGHCTFLSGMPYARWPNFETTALPVLHHEDGDPGCANYGAQVAGAVANIVGNYAGVNLTDAGTHSFVPTCAGGESATGNEFTNWVNANLPDTRQLLIQFDDPCDDITDLVGCNGTLAIGGLYWFGSTHTAEGMDWRNAAYGYIVVNNGSGACQCPSTDYEIMLTHEMTHSLNIGHIASAAGVANMNPSCCEGISALDIQCLDFIYAPVPLPVEIVSFEGEVVENTIALNWRSISENGNDFYTLEKVDNAGQARPLGEIPGKRNSTSLTEYQFIDVAPHAGYNYYRLSQTDVNQQKQIIEKIAIEYESDLTIAVNPNPLYGKTLNVAIDTRNKGEVVLEMYNLQGVQINSKTANIEKGRNSLTFNLENLPRGIYFLKTTQREVSKTVKFIRN